MTKKKILYIIDGETEFKKTDERVLNSIGIMKKLDYQSKWNYFNPKLIFHFMWAHSIVIWFASKHTFPAVILNYFFNKHLIIIAGGFDVANLPKIKYGAMQSGSRSKIGRWLLSRAHYVIAVSKSNRKEIIENGKVDEKRVRLIYHAVPSVNTKNIQNKKKIVLTVGEINQETYLRKGLDRFIQVAEKMQDVQFIHIGKWTDNKGKPCNRMIEYVKKKSPKNIQYLGYVDRDEMKKHYSESKVYLQLSRHEAFGVSVVEAMAHGCTPFVSNVFALPEVVYGNGFIVNNLKETIREVRLALNKKRDDKDYNSLKKYSVQQRLINFEKLFRIQI